MEDRYNKEHMHGDVSFLLPDYIPNEEQCRFLMLKVLEQAIRDYISLFNSDLSNEQTLWELARDFLFDNTYRINWGDWTLSTEEFLDIVDLNIIWVREQTIKKFESRNR